MCTTHPRKCFFEVFFLEERIFFDSYCENPGEATGTGNRVQSEGKLREEKPISEKVACSEASKTEHTTIKMLAWMSVNENMVCQQLGTP